MTSKAEINAAVNELANSDVNSLLAKLGSYATDFSTEPSKYSLSTPEVAIPARTAGALDHVTGVGKRILARWQRVLYDLVCGAGDPDVKKAVLGALTSPAALAAAITSILISMFSVAPGIAAVIGVLFGKLLLPAAGDEICAYWKERL